MKYPANAIINTVPAANELRKVSGFDPLKFLRRTTSERTGENVLKLELPYKRLWFRLACPNGRMIVKPLRVTDQLAVFEAMVYATKDDPVPLARFTSTASSKEAPDGKFVQVAQDTALNEALENAGFGIQLCDLIEPVRPTEYGSEIAVAEVLNARNTSRKQTVSPSAAPCEKAASPITAAEHAESKQTFEKTDAPVITDVLGTPEHVEAVPVLHDHTVGISDVQPTAETPKATMPQQNPVLPSQKTPQMNSSTGADVLSGQCPSPVATNSQPVQAAVQPAPAVTVTEVAAPAETHSELSYTPDMSVEEICKRMTLEEALNYTVQSGVCKGWTLAQVAERRAPSLRFYVYADNGDNVLKAAATLVLNDTSLRKAG